jgi:hypothetical protein
MDVKSSNSSNMDELSAEEFKNIMEKDKARFDANYQQR